MEQLFPRKDRRQSLVAQLGYSLLGSALLSYGVKKRSVAGGVATLVGADLICAGITGHHFHEVLGVKSFNGTRRRSAIPHQLGVHIDTSIFVGVDVKDAYNYMRDFQNLPYFMDHLQDVRIIDDRCSHWTARGPIGTTIEWDARIISDIPNQLISWTSENNPVVDNAGSVRFEPASDGRGTNIRVSMQYLPPAGALGAIVAKLLGQEPEGQIKNDLQHLKQVLEARYPLLTGSQNLMATGA